MTIPPLHPPKSNSPNFSLKNRERGHGAVVKNASVSHIKRYWSRHFPGLRSSPRWVQLRKIHPLTHMELSNPVYCRYSWDLSLSWSYFSFKGVCVLHPPHYGALWMRVTLLHLHTTPSWVLHTHRKCCRGRRRWVKRFRRCKISSSTWWKCQSIIRILRESYTSTSSLDSCKLAGCPDQKPLLCIYFWAINNFMPCSSGCFFVLCRQWGFWLSQRPQCLESIAASPPTL